MVVEEDIPDNQDTLARVWGERLDIRNMDIHDLDNRNMGMYNKYKASRTTGMASGTRGKEWGNNMDTDLPVDNMGPV